MKSRLNCADTTWTIFLREIRPQNMMAENFFKKILIPGRQKGQKRSY